MKNITDYRCRSVVYTAQRWLRTKRLCLEVSGCVCRQYEYISLTYWAGQTRGISLQLDTILLPPEEKFQWTQGLPGVCNLQSNNRPRILNLIPSVPSPRGIVLTIRPPTLNLTVITPRTCCFSPDVPSQVAMLATSMRCVMDKIENNELDIIWVRISICILPAHTDFLLKF